MLVDLAHVGAALGAHAGDLDSETLPKKGSAELSQRRGR
jgi:hypothetical protein